MSISELMIRVIVTIAVILAMARLNGPKQIAQMSFYDYVSGITAGSLAASTSLDSSVPLLHGLIAIVLFLSASILMGWMTEKSMALRRVLAGRPIVLIAHGEIQWNGLKKARLNMNELLSNLRYSGYFNVGDVNCAILEPIGKFSVQPRESARPPKTCELNIPVGAPAILANVIVDGVMMKERLDEAGKEEEWVRRELEKQGITDIREVGLATVDAKGTLTVYRRR